MKKYLLILSLLGILLGQQGQNNDVALSPVVTYWKTLTIEEKETFLFSYLVQVYETHTELKKDIGYGGITEWYYDNRAELVYGIFDHLIQVDIYKMVIQKQLTSNLYILVGIIYTFYICIEQTDER